MKKFYKNIAYLFSANSLSIAVPFLLAPFLTRLYSAEDFGIYAQFTAVASLIAILSTVALEYSILVPKNRHTSAILLKAAHVIAFLVFLFGMIFLLIADIFWEDFHWSFFLIPFYGFIISSQKIWNYWQNRNENYALMASSQTVKALSLSSAQLLFGLFTLNSPGLIMGDIVAQLLKLVLLVRKNFAKIFQSGLNKVKMIAALKTYRQFPIWVMPSEFFNFLSVQLPIFAFVYFFGEKAAGLYFLPHKILSTPLNALGNAISQVYYKSLNFDTASDEELSRLSESLYKKLFISGIWGFGLVFFFGEVLFSFIFGNNWRLSGLFASYLSPWLFMVYVFSPMSIIFIAKNKLKLSFLMNFSLLILRAGALLGAYFWLQSLEKTVLCYALSGFVYWLILSFYVLKFAKLLNTTILFFSLKHLVLAIGFLFTLKLFL